MPQQLKVMISSTALDLPEHRKKVVEACLRQNMFPLRMEDLPANSDEAAAASLKMVEAADVYVGVFAQRYGYVPVANNPKQISVTEMEYDRAVERKIERLIFVMDKSHPITVEDVDIENAAKLRTFKDRVQAENIVRFFKSPDDLRAEAINSLSKLRQPDLTTFHYVSEIPAPPEAFIAHPYTLLQTRRLVGRKPEFNLLTDWVAKRQEQIYWARVLSIVAIGGMGKSALTWKWFNDIAPQEMKPLAGRMWWSFYESDATFDNFVTRALAYVTQQPLEKVQHIPAPEREAQLLATLDHKPFLIVLDGLERILIAYARMDAAHLADDNLDRRTADTAAHARALPASAAQSFTGEHRLRKTADPRAGAFLRKLSRARAARVLISTRLYPTDLQIGTGGPLPGCEAIFLKGLADDDALELWRAFGVTGARDALLLLFNRVDNHPLLVQALASEVARYRRAPGDFDGWRRDHPDFNPSSLPLVQVKSHVLEFALSGLDDKARQALQVIAAFRMPARYDTLAALLTGEGRAYADEHELDLALTELEDRGLVGWDRRANRYDLHPIVRGVVWGGLGQDERCGVYRILQDHFKSLPGLGDYSKASSLEELTPLVESYNALIGLGRYGDAFNLFTGRLFSPALYRLSASRQCAELLEMFFVDSLAGSSQRLRTVERASALALLGLAYDWGGQPGRAAPLYIQASEIYERREELWDVSINMSNLASALQATGELRESEVAARRALLIGRERRTIFLEAMSLRWLGLTLAARGAAGDAGSALSRALELFASAGLIVEKSVVHALAAQYRMWVGDFNVARQHADRAWEVARKSPYKRLNIRTARRQGEAALGQNDLSTADERLHHALAGARAANFVEEELPSLNALAELRRRQLDLQAARGFLDGVWEGAERGPYPLFHADAYNVLAQIERDEGDDEKATEAAVKAYRLAWCDGPPFAYHWGLEKARKHLRELGAEESLMPAFDESKFEPMPVVEIDPEDEFHVGKGAEG